MVICLVHGPNNSIIFRQGYTCIQVYLIIPNICISEIHKGSLNIYLKFKFKCGYCCEQVFRSGLILTGSGSNFQDKPDPDLDPVNFRTDP